MTFTIKTMDTQPHAEENTLRAFGNGFQVKCLSNLITDRQFLERVDDILSVDYFEMDAHKWLLQVVIDYFRKYRDLPSKDVFKVEIMKLPDGMLKESVFDQLKKAYDEVNSSDGVYIKENFLEFCKNRKLRQAILAAGDFLKQGDYQSIWNVVNEASKAGIERNLGHDYFLDFDQRMSEAARDVTKTNWAIIDGHLDGGLGNGELGFVVAPAGSGKSWILSRIGVEALKQGKNVMHFTMELNEKYVGRRYDSCFSGIAFQDVRTYQDKVKESIKGVPGRLFIKFFPMNMPTSATLKAHIERVQLINKIKIDMVVVDYADLLKPSTTNKNSNSYEDGGSIYGDLRSMAGELQIPVWSASQSNRGAHEEEVVGALNVADSYKKIMIGDFIMSLSRTMNDKNAGTGRILIIKSRFGSDGALYPCSFDTSCGNIGIYDPKSIEGEEVLRKAKSAESNIKDIIRTRWKEVNKDEE